VENVSGNSEVLTELLQASQCGFECLEHWSLQTGMMSDELVDGGTNEDCILLVDQDFQMLLGGEEGEDCRYDAGTVGQLRLANLIQAERADGIGNGLDDLRDFSPNDSTKSQDVQPRWQARCQPQSHCKTPRAGDALE